MTDLLLNLYYVDLFLSLRKVIISVLFGSLTVLGLTAVMLLIIHDTEDVVGSSFNKVKNCLIKTLKISCCILVISNIAFVLAPGKKVLDLRYSTLSEQYLENVKKSKETEGDLVILELPEKTEKTE